MLAGETSKHRNEADDKLVFTIRAIANMYFFSMQWFIPYSISFLFLKWKTIGKIG